MEIKLAKYNEQFFPSGRMINRKTLPDFWQGEMLPSMGLLKR
jgi:hypothetical protein